MNEALREEMNPAIGVGCVAGGGVVGADIVRIGRECGCLLALLCGQR